MLKDKFEKKKTNKKEKKNFESTLQTYNANHEI